MLCFGNGTRCTMNTCRCKFLHIICPIELQKAERVSKTLRDNIKEQHMLSEIAENSNLLQESESGRKNANESTAIEGERNFTNQESQPKGEQNRTMPVEQQGYQRRKSTMDNQKFIESCSTRRWKCTMRSMMIEGTLTNASGQKSEECSSN